MLDQELTESFNIEIGIHLNQEVLEDVFVVAIEGGSNHWADFRFDHGKILNDDGTINYGETLREHGIDIYDVDSGDNFLDGCSVPRIKRYTYLDAPEFKRNVEDRVLFNWADWLGGFELYGKSNDKRGRELMIGLMQNGASEADADDADMILQYACFGEMIFS